MPKLIIINGPLGSGKSTLAREYASLRPMTLVLDIDKIWFMISGWRDNWTESLSLAKTMALDMAEVHLEAGHDVITPVVILDENLAHSLKNLAQKMDAELSEILIDVDRDEALRRYLARDEKPEGYVSGQESAEERKQKFFERFDKMNSLAEKKENIIRFKNSYGDIEGDLERLDSLI